MVRVESVLESPKCLVAHSLVTDLCRDWDLMRQFVMTTFIMVPARLPEHKENNGLRQSAPLCWSWYSDSLPPRFGARESSQFKSFFSHGMCISIFFNLPFKLFTWLCWSVPLCWWQVIVNDWRSLIDPRHGVTEPDHPTLYASYQCVARSLHNSTLLTRKVEMAFLSW